MKIDKEEKMRWKNNNDILFDIISLNYHIKGCDNESCKMYWYYSRSNLFLLKVFSKWNPMNLYELI